MRVHLVGGFLGAGKTTLIRSLARTLRERGQRVAVVTNDQGETLVDTLLCRDSSEAVSEVTGGCFCCNYSGLSAALDEARGAGADVVIAEAVGSCTDLIATVVSPLTVEDDDLELAPLAIVVDPFRLHEMGLRAFDEDVAYLFRKQIEEADVVLLSRADLDPPDVRSDVHRLAPDAAIVAVSGRTGEGLDDWLEARPKRPAVPLAIDYGRYAAAEALLGWSNGVAELRSEELFDPGLVISTFLEKMADAPVAHLKVATLKPVGGSGSLVRRNGEPIVDVGALPSAVAEMSLLVNARVALPPDELAERLRSSLASASAPATVTWEDFESFRPAPPEPTHRHAFRCGSGDDASCCAAFYDRAEVRYLLGDSLHPGGVDLTLRMAEHLGLGDRMRLLDVACGRATSLRAIARIWPITAVGLDAGAPAAPDGEDALELLRADVHDIPFDDAEFDAVLCECALSTFADQATVVREIARLLKPGGRVAVSDMVLEGKVPETLRNWIHVGTCLQGARSFDGYVRLLEASGLQVVERWDASDGLFEMIRRIKRNLVGLALAKAAGSAPVDVDIDVAEARSLLRQAERMIRDRIVGYGAYIAEKVA